MLYLNLVSQKLRQEIKLRHTKEMMSRVNFVLFFLAVFVAVLLVSAKIILLGNYKKIEKQTFLISQNSEDYNGKTQNINQKLHYIKDLQADFIPWSCLLEKMFKGINNGIDFYSININKQEKKISLKGIAVTRDDLINFKNNLDKTEEFYNVDFPIQNILEKKNINFNIEANIRVKKINYEF